MERHNRLAMRIFQMHQYSHKQLKLLAVRPRRTGNLRNVRKLFHSIAVRSLTPQQARGNALAGAFSFECKPKEWGLQPV